MGKDDPPSVCRAAGLPSSLARGSQPELARRVGRPVPGGEGLEGSSGDFSPLGQVGEGMARFQDRCVVAGKPFSWSFTWRKKRQTFLGVPLALEEGGLGRSGYVTDTPAPRTTFAGGCRGTPGCRCRPCRPPECRRWRSGTRICGRWEGPAAGACVPAGRPGSGGRTAPKLPAPRSETDVASYSQCAARSTSWSRASGAAGRQGGDVLAW